MSEKKFTIYVTGGTNVFVPVLSDDPKQVSTVLDILKKCYGEDDSEEIQAAISFLSDYLDELIPEREKKFSGRNNRKETRNGVEKGRFSFRLTAPYSEERRRAAGEAAKAAASNLTRSMVYFF